MAEVAGRCEEQGTQERPECLQWELGLSALPEFERPCRVCVCSGRRRAPLTLRLPSPCFPALVISCLWPDISREQMEGDYNEDLCVFRAGLVSQCRELGSPLPISIFHSRFGERRPAWGGGGGGGERGACLRGGGLITGLRVSRRAARLGEGLASESPPAGLEPAPASPQPGFVSPSAHPSSSPPPYFWDPGASFAFPSLCPSPGLRKRPLPLAPAPFCSPLQGLPGERHAVARPDPAAGGCQVR